MSLPNTGMSFTPFDPLTAAEMNDLVENIESLADGTGFNAGVVGASALATGAALGNLDSAATGGPFLEIGRATLGVAGDTITLSTIPARKYLQLLVYVQSTGGTINVQVRFNNDSGANYANRSSLNGNVDGTAVSQTSMGISSTASATDLLFTGGISNVLANEKLLTGHTTERGTAGAANAGNKAELSNKWANTSAQITRVDVINTGTGDFAIGSEFVVLGKN